MQLASLSWGSAESAGAVYLRLRVPLLVAVLLTGIGTALAVRSAFAQAVLVDLGKDGRHRRPRVDDCHKCRLDL